MEKNKISVLVVDDSPLMRKIIADILNNSGRIQVLDTAQNGQIALQKIEALNPDVITLDVDMPVMDGFTCLKKIMEDRPRPVLMLSGLTQGRALLTIRCLESGAFDFVSKPLGGLSKDIEKVSEEIVEKVIEAFNNKHRIALKKIINKRDSTIEPVKPIIPAEKKSLIARPAANSSSCIVGIGISTGGPVALRQVIPMLPPDFPATVLVQHMPDTFTKAFAGRLNSESQVEVKEAEDGDLIKVGRVLVAPGNYHMRVKKDRGFLKVSLSKKMRYPGTGRRWTFYSESLAEEVGAKTVAVLMTGMGRDSATGLGLIRQAGGHTMAQDETSCTVFGMPKVAIKENAACEIVHLSKITARLLMVTNQK